MNIVGIFIYIPIIFFNKSQYSILIFNLDQTGKLGETGGIWSKLGSSGVNLDLADPYLTS